MKSGRVRVKAGKRPAYAAPLPPELVRLERIASQLLLKLEPPNRPMAPTFEEFAPALLDFAKGEQQKPGTVHQKARDLELHVLPHFGALRLGEVTEAHVQDFKAKLRPRKAKTVNNILSVLSMVLKVAVKRKVLPAMPVTIEPVRTDETSVGWYEEQDYRALVAAAGAYDKRALALVLLGGDAGLRGGEIRALRWESVDFRRSLLTVERSAWEGVVTSTKGRKIRRVPMTVALKRALQALKKHSRSPLVLTRDDGAPVSRQTQRSWMAWAQRGAKLRATGGLHILRHTFCSRLAMLGAPPVAIRKLAGHSSLRTTLRYMHLAPSEEGRAIALLDGERQNSPQWEATNMRHTSMRVGPPGFETLGALRAQLGKYKRNPVDLLGPTAPFGRGHYYGSPKQVADLLHVPVRAVYRLINEGPLCAHRVGKRRLRIYRDELRRFLEAARVQ